MLTKKSEDRTLADSLTPAEFRGHLGFFMARARQALLDRMDEAIADPELRVRHFAVLSLLGIRQGLRQTDIATVFCLDRTSTMKTVSELEKRGLVRRSRRSEDRRANAVEITPAGRNWQESRRAAVENGEAEFLAPLSPGERTLLRELLAKLAVTVDK